MKPGKKPGKTTGKTTGKPKKSAKPLPITPQQEVVLRLRVAFMRVDVEQARREALEVQSIRQNNGKQMPTKQNNGKPTDRGPADGAMESTMDPPPLQVWWRGLGRADRQRLCKPLAHLGGTAFLVAARAAWKQERAEIRRHKKEKARNRQPGTESADAVRTELSPAFNGTIKFWQEDKGFGFIARKGAPDVFCHANKLLDRDSVPLKGQRVRYQLEPSPKKPGTMTAVNVRIEPVCIEETAAAGDV